MSGLVLAFFEIDVCEGIKLVHHDIDVVATDARTQASDAFALVCAGNCMKLTAFYLAFLRVEMAGNSRHTTWVANKNDAVSKLFWFDVKMENAAIFVDDKFR